MRRELNYRSHKIVASDYSGQAQAVVFVGRVQVTPQRLAARTLDDAVVLAKSWIDARMKEFKARQRAPHIGTAPRYEEYLAANKLKPHERAMLVAHAEDRVLTATQLAAAAGWDTYGAANLHYGLLGQQIATFLELSVPQRPDGTSECTMAIATSADADGESGSEHFRWAIHPELAQALVSAGVIDKPSWLDPPAPSN